MANRLPTPGGDDGNWGQILNDFLSVELDTDGTLKASGSLSGKVSKTGNETVAGVKTFSSSLVVPAPITGTAAANKAYVDSTVTAGAPDASASTKGLVQLTGDLGGTATSPTVPGLAAKEPTITAGTTSQYWRGDKSWQTLDKSTVGLANVDNTSDANKPISTATQSALDAKEASANKGAASGYAPLDSGSKVPTTNLGGAGADSSKFLRGDQTWAAPAATADATASAKGVVQLAGDLGGTAAAPTVPGLANKVAKGDLVINVKDAPYNAAGDGFTNDTAALNAAITAAAATGATVYIPASATLLVVPTTSGCAITAKPNVTLKSDGGTIKVASTNGTYYSIIGHVYSTDVSGFCVDGVTFDGGDVTAPTGLLAGQYQIAIDLRYGTGLSVTNCRFVNFDNINTIIINGAQSDGTNRCSDIKITGNSFIATGGPNVHDHSTIYVHGLRAVIADNVLVAKGTAAAPTLGAYGGIEVHGEGMSITGNYIEGYRDGANIGSAYRNHNFTFAGNTIKNALHGVQLFPQAIYTGVSPALKSIVVEGNSIQLTPDGWATLGLSGPVYHVGVFISSSTDFATEGLTISGNSVWCETYTGTDTAIASLSASGILFSRSGGTTHVDRNLSICNNSIHGFPGPGVTLSAMKAHGVSVAGNTIGNVGHDSIVTTTYKAAIWVSGEVVNGTIRGNRYYDDRGGSSPIRRGIGWYASSGSTGCSIFDNDIAMPYASGIELDIGATSGAPFVQHVLHGGVLTRPTNNTAGGSTITDTTTGKVWVQSTASAGNTWNQIRVGSGAADGGFVPSVSGLIASSFDPAVGASRTVTAGTGYAVRLDITADGTLITNLLVEIVTGVSGGANCYLGLYDSTGTKLGDTAEQSASWATPGVKTIALQAGPVTVNTGYVYLVILVGTGTAIAFNGSIRGAGNAGLSAPPYRFSTMFGSASAMPASITPSGSAATTPFWAGLT